MWTNFRIKQQLLQWLFFCCLRFQKISKFLEMDSEIIDSKKRALKWIQKWATIVASCSDGWFLFRKPRPRGGCQGASWPANSSWFDSGGEPFFEMIFGTLFSNRPRQLLQNGAKITQKTHFAQHTRPRFLLLFTALRGHWASQEYQKGASKLHQKINRFSNLKKSPPKLPKGAQKGEGETRLAPLGAPLAPQSVFWHEKCIQRAAKVTQGASRDRKLVQKQKKTRCGTWSQQCQKIP